MRKVLTSSVIVLMVFFLSAGIGLAGTGNGTGPIHDISAGTPFTYEGDVSYPVPGQGLLLALSDGTNVTIYGIGPVRYWESLGVDRPAVGDTVKADGYAVDYNGEVRNIAMSITVGTDTVQLRDPDTGVPLWRGKGPR